ncbi:UMP kinase [Candidatus Woesearchaeota archaeon]|nr:UMP kinase [Candidatus Woesearchaeota archaeon]
MLMKTIIISLGGSLIVPNQIDIDFLKRFRGLILQFAKNNRIAIICGGGKTCRIYQDAAKEIASISDEDLDWIGIKATRINAELVRSILGKDASNEVINDPEDKNIRNIKNKIIIGAGYLPGHSSDMDAVLLAKNIGADEIINMTNIDYVYDKDPRKFKDAKQLKNISWKEFIKIIGDKWIPGKNTPFDPVAAKEAMKLKIKVIILNGNDLENFRRCLDGKGFRGTVIV